jgi:hypothetical protein
MDDIADAIKVRYRSDVVIGRNHRSVISFSHQADLLTRHRSPNANRACGAVQDSSPKRFC